MSRIQSPFVVVEADVSVWHAWGDGVPVTGPTQRHRAIASGFRTGLRISQAPGADDLPGAFGEWRMNGPALVRNGGWTVECSSALGAVWDEGAQAASMLPPGTPVVVVVRFQDRAKPDLWRVYQFHDAETMPADATDDSQRMMRSLRFSAGWMEEFKSGVMPGLEPRLRGVIEWRHLGRVVRGWEYDPDTDTWAEDPENVVSLEGGDVRYVGLEIDGSDAQISMLAAVTGEGTLAGDPATVIGWQDVAVFSAGSSGLTLDPGWLLQTDGIAEPLLLPESGRHWEHPRLVFRVLGRTYATACAGVVALPSLTMDDPGVMLDMPLRMGALRMFPDGGWIW